MSLQEEFAQAKASWQGARYDDVVARWGPPAKSATLADGRETYTWISREPPVYGGGPQVGVGVFGGSGGGGGIGVGVGFPFGMTVNPAGCDRTLTFKDAIVVDSSWIGDPSYCTYFRR